MVSSLVNSWDKGIVNGWTVQVMPDESIEKTELRVNKVINFFENRDEIEKVSLVSDKKLNKLILTSWFKNQTHQKSKQNCCGNSRSCQIKNPQK